jgi:hypothetical protein
MPGSVHARTLLALIVWLWVAACAGAPPRTASPTAAPEAGKRVTFYVVKRGWHVDVGIARDDVQAPLASVAASFPDARYLLFGFGDRRYLLDPGGGTMAGALFPGAGLVMVTTLTAQPEDVFGPQSVAPLTLTTRQMSELEHSIAASLATRDGAFAKVEPGPHAVPGYSAFYESVQHYSALHTCNTWAAQVLESAELPVTSSGVEFASQLWSQVERLKADGAAPGTRAPQPRVQCQQPPPSPPACPPSDAP